MAPPRISSRTPPSQSSSPAVSPKLFLASWLDAQVPGLGLRESLEQGEATSLHQALQKLEPARQAALKNLFGNSFLAELVSLSGEKNQSRFAEALYQLANRQEAEGRNDLAFRIQSSLPALHDGKTPNPEMSSVLKRSMERLAILRGGGNFGNRAEHWLSSLSPDGNLETVPPHGFADRPTGSDLLSNTANVLNYAGGILGLASVASSYIRPLRPLAAAGIYFLSKPAVSAALVASGTYALAREAPEAWSAAGRLWKGEEMNSYGFADALTVSGFALGALSLGIGLASFGLGGYTYRSMRHTALAEGYGVREAHRVAWYQADAVRRAVHDPEIWVQFARGNPYLRPWQRVWLSRAGVFSNRSLLYGSAAIGVGRFAEGLQGYAGNNPSQGQSPVSLSALLLGLAMDVTPAVTVHLYRAARGNQSYGLGPAMSQDLSEGIYDDPGLRNIVLQRLEEGIPPLSPETEQAFLKQAKTDLAHVENALHRAEQLSPMARPGPSELVEGYKTTPSEIPPSPPPVTFAPEAHWVPLHRRAEVSGYDLSALRKAYASGKVSPTGVLHILLEHSSARNGAIFPRPLDHGRYRRHLLNLAKESDRRFREGTARPLEGVLVAVKDIFPGIDGRMHAGSKTARIQGNGNSPVVQTLMEFGAIPITVGMVAAASGGSGMHAGFGYIAHPTRHHPEFGTFDPAGSSSATAHVVGHPELPIAVGIGTDTGGSVSAPAGTVGIFGFVPPANMISTKNMVPFATFLDRVGVLAKKSHDAMGVARYLSKVVGGDPHLRIQNPGARYQPSTQQPVLAYLESLVKKASPRAQENFLQTLKDYRGKGYEIRPLGPEWDFIAEVPMRLYPFDAFGAGVFTHTNPLQGHPFDPPRRVLDDNLAVRLPKGGLSLRLGFYDRARELSRRYENLMSQKIGDEVVLASPATEAIPTPDILSGKAGSLLDGHDRITMTKNRLAEWGQLTVPSSDQPEVGVALSGRLPHLVHFTGEFPSIFRTPRISDVHELQNSQNQVRHMTAQKRLDNLPTPASVSLAAE